MILLEIIEMRIIKLTIASTPNLRARKLSIPSNKIVCWFESAANEGLTVICFQDQTVRSSYDVANMFEVYESVEMIDDLMASA